MNKSESVRALRRANPRSRDGFAESVDALADAVRARIANAADEWELQPGDAPERRRARQPQRRRQYMPQPAETRSHAGSFVMQRRIPSAPSVAV